MKRRSLEPKNRIRLPGYTLLYVLFLLTMLAMILAGLITFRFFIRRQSLEWMGRSETERNVASGISLLRDPFYIIPEGQRVTISLFNGINDSVVLCRSQWGFFDLLKSSATFKNYTYSRISLCGSYRPGDRDAALLLGGSFKPLCVCGNTFLKGIFRVPKAGIKAAAIAGKYYRRKELAEGVIDATDRPLPMINPRYKQLQPNDFLQRYTLFSHVIHLTNGIYSDTLCNSFSEPTVILYAKDEILLKRCVLKGNILIISDSLIQVDSTAHITDAILCAKKIFIESRFKGTGQFIATDTLRCGRSCTFQVPSILAIINRETNPSPFIFIDKQCRLEGTMLVWSSEPIKPYTSIGDISEHSTIVGSLYTNQEITLQGEIHGNIIAPGFILRNPVAIYQNYLVDAVIDYSRRPDYYTGIAFDKNSELLNIIKWVQ